MHVNTQVEICSRFFFFVIIARYSLQLISFPWIPEGEFSIFHNEKEKPKVDTLPD